MKNVNKITLVLFLIGANIVTYLSAQVTVGSNLQPAQGAILDLKEHAPDANNATSSKGLSMPRVALKVPDDLTDLIAAPTTVQKAEHVGLWVYNTSDSAHFCPGLHVWNGQRWQELQNIITPQSIISTDQATNSFVVKQGAVLQFPVYKAYAVAVEDPVWRPILNTAATIDFDGDPSAWDVKLVWQDRPGLIQSLDIIRGNEGKYSQMVVRTNPLVCAQGNALVAVTVNGVICWTWHIWVTDFDPVVTQKTYNNGTVTTTFMDRNLGALTNNGNTPANALKAMGLLYQWGRHTPFTSSAVAVQNSGYNGKPIYSIDNTLLTSGTPTGGTGFNAYQPPVTPDINLANALQNPMNFYFGASGFPNYFDWYSSLNVKISNDNLWNTTTNTKAVFDPCPSGWRVPYFTAAGSTSPWYNITVTGSTSTGFMLDNIGYYPAAGYRSSGDFAQAGTAGSYYSSGPSSSYTAPFMSFTLPTQTIFPSVSAARQHARAIRCAKE